MILCMWAFKFKSHHQRLESVEATGNIPRGDCAQNKTQPINKNVYLSYPFTTRIKDLFKTKSPDLHWSFFCTMLLIKTGFTSHGKSIQPPVSFRF